ncbi:MAG: translocation/assembly module TamB domain-containing protein [Zoogloeaceae bacterium]|nr:translocation/assembly module TamB domain-containing protein [Zoogloeaceae bacterium]
MTDTPPPAPRPKRRWPAALRWTAGILLFLVLLLLGLTAWVFTTEAGLRGTTALVNRLADGQVVLEAPSGRLAGAFGFERVSLRLPDIRSDIDGLSLSWQPFALGSRRVDLAALKIDRISLATRPSDEPPTSPQMPDVIHLPVALDIGELSVGRFELHDWTAVGDQPGVGAAEAEPSFFFTNLYLSLDSDGAKQNIRSLKVSFPFGDLDLSGAIDSATEAFPLALETGFRGAHAGREFDLQAKLGGDLHLLKITLEATGAGLSGQAELQVSPFKHNPVRQLVVDLGEIDPAAFVPEAPAGAITIHADLRGDAEQALALSGAVRIDNRLPGALDEGGIPLVSLAGEVSFSPTAAGVSDLVVMLPGDGRLSGSANWLADATGNTLGRLTAGLTLAGVNTHLIQTTLPDTVVAGRIDAEGDQAGQTGKLDLKIGDASMKAAGSFVVAGTGGESGDETPRPARFEASGVVSALDPAAFVPGAPAASLNLSFAANGALAETPAIALEWTFAPSRIEEMALDGRGRLALEGARVADADVALRVAGNSLSARGRWGAPGDNLQLVLDAPALGALGHGLGGQARVEGRLSGTQSESAGELSLSGDKLRLPGDVRIDRLKGQARLASSIAGPIDVKLQAGGVGPAKDLAENWLNTLALVIDGRRDQHNINLTLSTPDEDKLTLALKGALAEAGVTQQSPGPHWKGRIESLDIAGRVIARLVAPASLVLAQDRVELGAAGFDAGKNGKVSLAETRWSPAEVVARGSVSGVILDLVPRTSPRTREQRDPLTMGAEWDLRLARTANGRARVFRESGDLRIPGEFSTRVGLENFETLLTLADNRLDLSVAASGTEFGELKASLAGLLEKDAATQWRVAPNAPLNGQLNLSMPSIAWLSRLVQAELALGGSVSADLTLAGTAAKPVPSGRLVGNELSVVLLDQGVSLSGGELLAEFDPDRVRLTRLEFVSANTVQPADRRVPFADLTVEPGRLLASGAIELESGAGSFAFNADRFPVLQRPDRWMLLSGQGVATSTWTSLDLDADFAVDSAFVEFSDTPPPSLSDDVVIAQPTVEETAGGLKVTADVRVSLGENLYLSGFGLQTRLTGGLRLRVRDGEPLNATGSVSTVGGVFAGYGQNLTITRGLINFQGPIDNPGLNIVALRTGLVVEAGVSVSGTARRPLIRLVSEPNVPDAEKLSWIVLGRAPDSGSGGDMALLLPAAQALLGEDGIPAQLSRSLGFDEFGIGQGELGGVTRTPTSRVVGGGSRVSGGDGGQVLRLGKRLTSDMSLAFEQSLGGAESLVKLSYQLTRRLSWVLRSGADVSSDIYYTISFR